MNTKFFDTIGNMILSFGVPIGIIILYFSLSGKRTYFLIAVIILFIFFFSLSSPLMKLIYHTIAHIIPTKNSKYTYKGDTLTYITNTIAHINKTRKRGESFNLFDIFLEQNITMGGIILYYVSHLLSIMIPVFIIQYILNIFM